MLGKRLSLVASLGFTALLLLAPINSALAIATAPTLGTASSFAVLAGSTVTNTGNTIVRGDLGLSPGTAVTGFPPGLVVPPGTTHVADAVALGAQNDATTAYNVLAGEACDFGPLGRLIWPDRRSSRAFIVIRRRCRTQARSLSTARSGCLGFQDREHAHDRSRLVRCRHGQQVQHLLASRQLRNARYDNHVQRNRYRAAEHQHK